MRQARSACRSSCLRATSVYAYDPDGRYVEFSTARTRVTAIGLAMARMPAANICKIRLKMSTLILALKIVVSFVFVAAAVLKFTGKNGPDWERWGFPRQAMYATGVAEIVGLVLLWWPGLQFAGAVLMTLVLLGALATL